MPKIFEGKNQIGIFETNMKTSMTLKVYNSNEFYNTTIERTHRYE